MYHNFARRSKWWHFHFPFFPKFYLMSADSCELIVHSSGTVCPAKVLTAYNRHLRLHYFTFTLHTQSRHSVNLWIKLKNFICSHIIHERGVRCASENCLPHRKTISPKGHPMWMLCVFVSYAFFGAMKRMIVWPICAQWESYAATSLFSFLHIIHFFVRFTSLPCKFNAMLNFILKFALSERTS